MTADMQTSIRASRRRVARSRGALSGILLMILGLWAALVPFIGPSFDLAYTPKPNSSWHWTAARGWLEVLPGAAAFLGGLLLLISASRAMTLFGGWLAALAGAWMVIGPQLAKAINLNAGTPDPAKGTNTQAATALLFFYAVGAAILFFASVALGRLSVLSVRDLRAAERRAEALEAEREAQRQAVLEEEADRRPLDSVEEDEAGRHAERPTAITNAPYEGDGAARHGQAQPVPQYAGGPQHPPVHDGAAGQPGQYPTQPYGQPGQPGQGPMQPGGPTQQYPAAPPPRE